MPACVIAGVVTVGDCDTPGDEVGGIVAFARPKSSTLTGAVGPHLAVGGLQIAADDALLVRGFEGVRDLFRDGQRFVEGTLRDPRYFADEDQGSEVLLRALRADSVDRDPAFNLHPLQF
jgi:hypothetical protein